MFASWIYGPWLPAQHLQPIIAASGTATTTQVGCPNQRCNGAISWRRSMSGLPFPVLLAITGIYSRDLP